MVAGSYSNSVLLHAPGTDDAVATFTLPFAFPMYCHTYPSGTTVTVSSNGWLTLTQQFITAADNQDLSQPCVNTTSGPTNCDPPGMVGESHHTGGGCNSILAVMRT